MATTYKIKGIKELEKKLNQLKKSEYLPPLLEVIGQEVITKTSPYPPVPAGSKYIRGSGFPGGKKKSERLGNKWFAKREGKREIVGNTASYAKWVHGDDTQAHWHGEHGWKRLKETTLDVLPNIVDDILKKIDEIWGS